MTARTAPRAALARVDALHTALTQIVLEGGDLDRIAEEVARVLDVGVLVTSTDGRERASHLRRRAPRRRCATHGLLDPTGRVRVERVGPTAPPSATARSGSLRVAAGGEDLARLVCVPRRRRRSPPTTCDALERAAAVAALLITREEAVTAVENKYQGDFLRDVFLRPGRRRAVRRRSTRPAFGWDLGRPVVVVAPPRSTRPRPATSRSRERSAAATLAGAVLRRLARRSTGRSTRGSRASTSPPRWSRCCRSPTATTSRWPATASYAGWSPRWPATRAAAGGRSRSG